MFLFGAGCVIALLGAVAVTAKDPTPAQIDSVFARFAHPDSPGCAVVVEQDGKVLYAKGYGMANLDYGLPITPATVFHVASVSKEFTAFAIQLLVQDGKVKLEDDIRKYIPEMHEFGKTIQVQNLLHHTSGLRDQWNLCNLGGWRPDDVITQEDLLGLLFRQHDLSFDPGAEYSYSNSNYTLLALIVERVSKKSLREYCEERIFRPLGMTNTHFHDDYNEIVPNRATSYSRNKKRGYDAEVLSFSNVGATSLFTTVEDFAKWTHNFDDPKVGGPEVIKRMQEVRPLSDGRRNSYASGISVGGHRGLPTVGHSGSDAGFRSDFVRFPAQHFSVACFSNFSESNPDRLTRQVAGLYLESQFEPPKAAPRHPSATVDDATLKSYAGVYAFSPALVGSFTFKSGQLSLKFAGQDSVVLQPESQSLFRSRNEVHYEFVKAGDGLECRRVAGEEQQMGKRLAKASRDLDAFVGDYYSDELRQVYRVESLKKGLRLVLLKEDDDLATVAQDVFNFGGWVVRFERDTAGRPSRMYLSSGRSYNIEFDRVDLKQG